jgi:hypothetical protein
MSGKGVVRLHGFDLTGHIAFDGSVAKAVMQGQINVAPRNHPYQFITVNDR